MIKCLLFLRHRKKIWLLDVPGIYCVTYYQFGVRFNFISHTHIIIEGFYNSSRALRLSSLYFIVTMDDFIVVLRSVEGVVLSSYFTLPDLLEDVFPPPHRTTRARCRAIRHARADFRELLVRLYNNAVSIRNILYSSKYIIFSPLSESSSSSSCVVHRVAACDELFFRNHSSA